MSQMPTAVTIAPLAERKVGGVEGQGRMERPALVANSSVRTVAPAPVSQTSDPITEDRAVGSNTRKLMFPNCQPVRLASVARVEIEVVWLVRSVPWQLVPWHCREVLSNSVGALVVGVPASPES